MILASASPRRHELLKRVVAHFEVVDPGIDEEALSTADPWQTAELLALHKAREVFGSNPNSIVIGGDTVVAIAARGEHLQLAKPSDIEHAKRMLAALSGREHIVITALAIVSPEGEQVGSETTRVRFRPLEQEEIEAYVSSGEPMDKAGAYAIQGGAAHFVQSIDGPLDNVIGLPTDLLIRLLGSLSC